MYLHAGSSRPISAHEYSTVTVDKGLADANYCHSRLVTLFILRCRAKACWTELLIFTRLTLHDALEEPPQCTRLTLHDALEEPHQFTRLTLHDALEEPPQCTRLTLHDALEEPPQFTRLTLHDALEEPPQLLVLHYMIH